MLKMWFAGSIWQPAITDDAKPPTPASRVPAPGPVPASASELPASGAKVPASDGAGPGLTPASAEPPLVAPASVALVLSAKASFTAAAGALTLPELQPARQGRSSDVAMARTPIS